MDTEQLIEQEYRYGFVTDVESEKLPKGLSEETIRLISAKKQEPDFLLDFRLQAYHQWLASTAPRWPNLHYPDIDYQAMTYYSAPKKKAKIRFSR